MVSPRAANEGLLSWPTARPRKSLRDDLPKSGLLSWPTARPRKSFRDDLPKSGLLSWSKMGLNSSDRTLQNTENSPRCFLGKTPWVPRPPRWSLVGRPRPCLSGVLRGRKFWGPCCTMRGGRGRRPWDHTVRGRRPRPTALAGSYLSGLVSATAWSHVWVRIHVRIRGWG